LQRFKVKINALKKEFYTHSLFLDIKTLHATLKKEIDSLCKKENIKLNRIKVLHSYFEIYKTSTIFEVFIKIQINFDKKIAINVNVQKSLY
jgi:hypothetical protein